MRKSFLLFPFILLVFVSMAQDKTVQEMQNQATRTGKDDTSKKSNKTWKLGGNFSLGLGQGGSRNWAAGAEKFSISAVAVANLYANRKFGKWNWENTLDLGYAMVNTSSQGVRKNDDKIDFFSKMGRSITNTLNLSIIANIRSQFNDGFDYNYLGKGYKRRTSGFMAPAYATFAPGLDWRPIGDDLSIFISPASARLVVVTNEPKSYYFQGGVIPTGDGGGFEMPLSTYYGVDPARQVRFELGAFASINYKKEIFKNVKYKTRFDLYSNFLKSYRFEAIGPDQLLISDYGPKPQNVDVYWTNTINMSVNKWLHHCITFSLFYKRTFVLKNYNGFA